MIFGLNAADATVVDPLQWFWRQWTAPGSPLLFQAFVPFGAIYLAWTRRETLSAMQRELVALFPPESKKRRGPIVILLLGCALMLFSYLTWLTSVAMLGAVVIAVGIILYLYGPFITRALTQPLLFLILMVPPPANLLAYATGKLQFGAVAAVGQTLQAFHTGADMRGVYLLLPHYTLEVSSQYSGLGIILPVLALMILVLLLRQTRIMIALIILVVAFGIALLLNVFRVLLIGVAGVLDGQIAAFLYGVTDWVYVALAFYLSLLAANRIGRRRSTDAGLLFDVAATMETDKYRLNSAWEMQTNAAARAESSENQVASVVPEKSVTTIATEKEKPE